MTIGATVVVVEEADEVEEVMMPSRQILQLFGFVKAQQYFLHLGLTMELACPWELPWQGEFEGT